MRMRANFGDKIILRGEECKTQENLKIEKC